MSETVGDIAQSIDAYIDKISEGHRMHRKVKFLLDVRGLLVINKLEGDYVEFGFYRGEMMYAAARILAPRIRRYIGLDTFTGLPKPQQKERPKPHWIIPAETAGRRSLQCTRQT